MLLGKASLGSCWPFLWPLCLVIQTTLLSRALSDHAGTCTTHEQAEVRWPRSLTCHQDGIKGCWRQCHSLVQGFRSKLSWRSQCSPVFYTALEMALTLLRVPRILRRPWVPEVIVRATFSPEYPMFGSSIFSLGRAYPTWGLASPRLSRSVLPSPAAGLGVGVDEGSPGHSDCSGISSSPLH